MHTPVNPVLLYEVGFEGILIALGCPYDVTHRVTLLIPIYFL